MRLFWLLLPWFVFLNNFYVLGQDWPDWRGVNRDGIWSDNNGIEKFECNQPQPEWKVAVGSGYSGPTVANGKVYLTDRMETPEETEGVLCFDEKTGDKIWEFRYNCAYSGIGYPAGPRASVVIHEGKAWSLGTMGHLFCFDAASGKVLWQKDLNSEYEIKMPIWGIAATPLIEGDKIILQIGGSENACLVALNKNTGEEIWRNLDDGASYSAPVIFGKNGKRVLVVWTEDHLAGMHPETGEVYWKFPWKLKMAMGIATPVLYNDYIFVSSFYNGSMLVDLGDDYTTSEKVWQRSGESERNTDALHCVMNTPVIIDDYIYGVDSYGELRCLEILTGDRVWENLTAVNKNRWANIHFIQNEEKVWMFNEHGELLITRLSPKGMTEIDRTKIIEPTKKQLPRGVTWAHPAFANGHIFIRNDSELISVRLVP
jgi:outer membrane protein assembly factor BamB